MWTCKGPFVIVHDDVEWGGENRTVARIIFLIVAKIFLSRPHIGGWLKANACIDVPFRKNIMRIILALIFTLLLQPLASAQSLNPPAPGFDLAGSDALAIALADKVMEAQGGRKAYDAVRYLRWTFFGRRTLLWDKWQGRVRIDWKNGSRSILGNIHDGTGKVRLDGVEQTHPDSLQKYLQIGKEVWINDSYWLVMPFKLKDSGVTLRYLSGSDSTADGRAAHRLQMTFQGVGVTPENKYHIWVDQERNLITQWAFFEKFTDEKPGFVNPWSDYKTLNGVLFSSSRGRGGMTDIETPLHVDDAIFERF
jgi:hypothetical protein